MSTPTPAPPDLSGEAAEWEARPRLARAVRLTLAAAPVLVSVALCFLVGRVLPPDRVGLHWLPWWIGLISLSVITMKTADRLGRRLLPFAALLDLTMVLPDNTPRRFAVALRAGSTKQLSRGLAEGSEHQTELETIEGFLALADRISRHDRRTRGHSERVRAYTDILAEELGLEPEAREKLRWAALVHDAGKLDVPGTILDKPGSPDDEEWARIRQHPGAAHVYLEPLRPWLGEWIRCGWEHHERWDGAGYPAGLAGEDIHIGSRIVAVADAYDVMTSVRSYKESLPATVARTEIIRHAGSQFDPEVVRALMSASIGDLRKVMGPLSWLAGTFEALGRLPLGQILGGVAATTAAASGLALVPDGGAPPPDRPGEVAIEIAEDTTGRVALPFELQPGQSIELVSTPDRGALEPLDDGRPGWTYVPDADAFGVDAIDYSLCNADGQCADGRVTIEVTGVDDPTVVGNDSFTVDEDAILIVATEDLLANDHDIDDILTVVAVTGANSGTVEASGSAFTYRPDPDTHGSDRLLYELSSGATGVIDIEVLPVNDPPTVTGPGSQQTPIGVDLAPVTAHDPDGDPLVFRAEGLPAGLSMDPDSGAVTGTPAAGVGGNFAVVVTVSDGRAEASITITVSVRR